MNNPQYRVQIGAVGSQNTGSGDRKRVPVKLTVEGARKLPLNVKLVWSGGQRVSESVLPNSHLIICPSFGLYIVLLSETLPLSQELTPLGWRASRARFKVSQDHVIQEDFKLRKIYAHHSW